MRVDVRTKLEVDTIRVPGPTPAGLDKLVGQQVVIHVYPSATGAVGKRHLKLTARRQLRAYKKFASASRRRRATDLVDEQYTAECRAAVAARGVVTAEQARQATAGVTADLTAPIRAERRGG